MDILFIVGAPGVGKTTLCRILKERLSSPCLEMDWIRSAHLRADWRDASPEEERLSEEILASTLERYLKFGFKNILVVDAQVERIKRLKGLFPGASIAVLTFFLEDANELKRRILNLARDSGNHDYEGSFLQNRALKAGTGLENEHIVEVGAASPEETVEKILRILKG
jgi:GTPase SAR1 family protein